MAETQFRSVGDVLESIEEMAPEISSLVTVEPIHVYHFLQQRFRDGANDLRQDLVFQFVFRSFYRMDSAGLGEKLKEAFFSIFQQHSQGVSTSDIPTIVHSLSQVNTLQGESTLQFSFATKMAATINQSLPIYDSFVADLFDFSPAYHIRDMTKRLRRFMRFYAHLAETIEAAKRSQPVQALVREVGTRTNVWADIGWVKQIDFILWAAGKVLRNNQRGNQALP